MANERVFISYSRRDGEAAARDLRQRLMVEGLSVWQDLIALESSRDWWTQIDEALRSKSLQHFILVVTPGALASEVVRKEIRLARGQGKQIHLVRGPGFANLNVVPRWMGHVSDLAIAEQWTVLLNTLTLPSQQKRAPMTVPEPPSDFVKRPRQYEALKRALLTETGDSAVGISAALRGAGGYGKTTLAKALAHDADIQEAFFDGILWVELGEYPVNLLGTLIDIIERLTGDRPGLENINSAAAALGEALGDRRVLLVIDDAWKASDLRPFMQGGRYTTRLVTTRLERVLPEESFRQPIDAMEQDEALQLLCSGLPADQLFDVHADLLRLVVRLGEWAQLLRLTNGFLRQRIGRGESTLDAVASVYKRLDAKGLSAFDPRDEVERTRAISRTIEVSLELLSPAWRQRFVELSVFPEDEDIPISVAAAIWSKVAGLDDYEAEDALNEFFNLSLVLSLDLHRRTFRFHDTIRQYIRHQAGAVVLAHLNKLLVEAIDAVASAGAADLRRYDLRFRPLHLFEAHARAELNQLLTSPAWIEQKFLEMGGVASLVDDFERYASVNDPVQAMIGRALRLSSGILARDPRQLMSQLHGRLMGTPGATSFASDAFSRIPAGALFETLPALPPPGPEIFRIEGHNDTVFSLLAMPDGRLVTGSDTIRIWDVSTGLEVTRLDGHGSAISALARLSDGRIASGDGHGSMRLWEASGASLELRGHKAKVTGLAALPNLRLASGSDDCSVRIWDIGSGQSEEVASHRLSIHTLAFHPRGYLVYSTGSETYVWDIEKQKLVLHRSAAGSPLVLEDGCIVSDNMDGQFEVWSPDTGNVLFRFEGTAETIFAMQALSGDRFASAGEDKCVRIWDIRTGELKSRLDGHGRSQAGGAIWAMACLPDGRLVSGSGDMTARVWDTTRGGSQGVRHQGAVTALAPLASGRIASCGLDCAVRIWNAAGVEEAARFGDSRPYALAASNDQIFIGEGGRVRVWNEKSDDREFVYRSIIQSLLPLPNKRIAAAAGNAILILDEQLNEVLRLEGHSLGVRSLEIWDGRLVSGSIDGTIRIWDIEKGNELLVLQTPTGLGTACLKSTVDNKLACAGSDGVSIWARDEASPSLISSNAAESLATLPNGQIAAVGDDRIVRLYRSDGHETARMELDAGAGCVTVLDDGRLVVGDGSGRIHWLAVK
jgi:WD40 repeat protein